MRQRKSARGFTLIELMIVVVVVAILAAFAYPSYRDYVMRSRRADAKAALLRVSLAEEKWRANNVAYTTTLGVGGLDLPATSPDGYYTVAISGVTSFAYTITATPQGSQAEDSDCPSFTLDQDNAKGGNPGCW